MTDRVSEALDIAISLMERHLAVVNPGGIADGSNAVETAKGRVQTLKELRSMMPDLANALEASSRPGVTREEIARVQRIHDSLKGHGNGEMQRDRRALAAMLKIISPPHHEAQPDV